MRISVEIDEKILEDAIKLTGQKGKGPACTHAIAEFVKRRKAAEFGRMIREGVFDYPEVSEEEEQIVTPPAE